MPDGSRVVVVVEYEVAEITPETMHEVGTIVRQRMVEEDVAGALFVSAHVAVGSTAFRIVELLPLKH